MDEALLAKFRHNAQPRQRLLETGQRPLEWGDPCDIFWGSTYDGTGQNHMGHSLERVRHILRDEHYHWLLSQLEAFGPGIRSGS